MHRGTIRNLCNDREAAGPWNPGSPSAPVPVADRTPRCLCGEPYLGQGWWCTTTRLLLCSVDPSVSSFYPAQAAANLGPPTATSRDLAEPIQLALQTGARLDIDERVPPFATRNWPWDLTRRNHGRPQSGAAGEVGRAGEGARGRGAFQASALAPRSQCNAAMLTALFPTGGRHHHQRVRTACFHTHASGPRAPELLLLTRPVRLQISETANPAALQVPGPRRLRGLGCPGPSTGSLPAR